MAGTQRQRELRRRRSRSKKIATMKAKVGKATKSEKEVMATKLRRMTPGAEVLIQAWQLQA